MQAAADRGSEAGLVQSDYNAAFVNHWGTRVIIVLWVFLDRYSL